MTETDLHKALARLIWPIRLTLIGLWAERFVRAFWPLWTILIGTVAGLAFGLQDNLPVEAAWIGVVLPAAGALWAMIAGWRAFHRPTQAEALARLDATLPGQPLSALTDTQVIGGSDPASIAVWQAHRERMARRAAAARAVSPNLKLASRDPYALRYVALTVLVLALLFGSIWRAASVSGVMPGGGNLAAAGPTWEGWAKPPAYTGKPALYLNDITGTDLSLPVGTAVQLRFYGEVGNLTLAETVSGRLNPPPASDPTQEFEVRQSGRIGIEGTGGHVWKITALADAPPSVSVTGEISREKDGKMNLPFTAKDDYGVTGGQATIALDLAAVTRRYGLAIDPEPRDPIVLDLPMPMRGKRTEFSENLIDDISKHAFANLPVTITLTAKDAANQTASSAPLKVTLPGKRFFDPMAAALIEMRRDLLWSRANAPRAVQILKAVTNRPDDIIRNDRAYLRLRVVIRQLETQAATLTPKARDDMAEQLWSIALLIEEGDLTSALERLRRAQDQLDEAIRNGADPAEIDRLMQEMREALDNYMNQLAQENQRNPDKNMAENQQGMEMTGDQLQQMLDELQKLMNEGKTAEAAQLMEMLRKLMENMQVTQGPGGTGGSPGQQAMRDLQNTLRDQQGLSDDAFQQLQDDYNGSEGDGSGSDPQAGDQPPQDGQGDGTTGQEPGQSLAERQGELRRQLDQLNNGTLPGDGSEKGAEGRQALNEAGRAMDDAEQSLRNDDISGALDKQAEAMDAMRKGMRDLGEALAENQRQQGQPAEGDALGRNDPNGNRDPLGRELGDSGRIGSDRNMLQGQDVYRRAQDLLDEIRRRSGEQTRPQNERDYLRRLLDLF